jgi:uncharacterized protein
MIRQFSPITLRILFLISLLALASFTAYSQESTKPFSINESPLAQQPTSPVMDYVGVLDAATKQALEQRIIAFRDSTNPKVELAVAIVGTTGERPIFDYSLAVARGWKIGSKEDDNPSALLFVAVNDRKYFTQVSKDLEDELPDGLVGQLQRQYLVPAFRQQNYGKGVSDTIEAYIRTIESKGNVGQAPAGKTNQPNQSRRQEKGSISICGIAVCLIVLFVFVLPILSRFGSSKKRKGYDDDDWRGGGFGGGGAASALPWVIGSILASGSGSSGSSSSGWGGGSSGGDSWGGFGGGGDFGGGGAGGDW